MKHSGIWMKFEVSWSYFDYDFDCEVSGWYHPGRPAKISGPPESCYPEDPDEWEYEEVVGLDGLSHDELADNEAFDDMVLGKARKEYGNLCDERNADQAADRAYWRDYDNGR